MNFRGALNLIPRLVIEKSLMSESALWLTNIVPISLKSAGDSARIPVYCVLMPFRVHAKIDISGQLLMISSCNRIKALPPSPYKTGMLTSNIPSRQYARSSCRVVSRCPAQDILTATGTSLSDFVPAWTYLLMPVIGAICISKLCLSPQKVHFSSKKAIF